MSLDNAQYDAIMREYERTRRTRLKERDARTEEIYEKIPSFRALDEEIPDISASFAIDRLMGKPRPDSELHEALSGIAARKKQLLSENGYPEDYLEIVYTCPDCRDTGYTGQDRCHCLQTKIRRLLYAQSNLEALFPDNNFDVMREDYYEGEDLRRFQGAVSVCRTFIERFQASGNDSPQGNILFYGTVGSGKSFLSIATARELLDLGHSVLYFSATDLFGRIADITFDYERRAERRDFTGDLYDCALLIIDDLGTETGNAFISSQLFSLINERVLRRRSTIISTNFDPAELRERYSDRVFSRLMTCYTVCTLTSRDVRLLRKM